MISAVIAKPYMESDCRRCLQLVFPVVASVQTLIFLNIAPLLLVETSGRRRHTTWAHPLLLVLRTPWLVGIYNLVTGSVRGTVTAKEVCTQNRYDRNPIRFLSRRVSHINVVRANTPSPLYSSMTTPSVSAHEVSTSQSPRPILPLVQPENSNLDVRLFLVSHSSSSLTWWGVGVVPYPRHCTSDRFDTPSCVTEISCPCFASNVLLLSRFAYPVVFRFDRLTPISLCISRRVSL